MDLAFARSRVWCLHDCNPIGDDVNPCLFNQSAGHPLRYSCGWAWLLRQSDAVRPIPLKEPYQITTASLDLVDKQVALYFSSIKYSNGNGFAGYALNLQRVKLGLQQDYGSDLRVGDFCRGYSCATWWRSCNRDKSLRGRKWHRWLMSRTP